MGHIFHLGGQRAGLNVSSGGDRFSLGGTRALAPALSDAQRLVADLLAYSPTLLLLGDLGTLQGDGTACASGDPLTAATATWQDQSGQGNDATQPTVMSRPRVASGALGGRAALLFDGMDDYLTSLASMAPGQCLYLIACKPGSTNTGSLLDLSSPMDRTSQLCGFNYLVGQPTYSWTWYVGAPGPGGVVDLSGDYRNYQLVTLVAGSGTAMSARINGVGTAVFDRSHGLAGLTLGANNDGSNPAALTAAAVVMSTGLVPDIETALMSYYGLSA